MRSAAYIFAAALLAASSAAAAAEGSAALAADRLKLADSMLARGMASAAAVEYEALLGEDGVSKADVLYRLGESRRQMGEAAKAREAYERVIREFPASPLMHRARFGRALLLPPDQAEAELLKLDAGGIPDDIKAAALYQLGTISEKKPGGAKEAAARYAKLVAAYPKHSHADYARIRTAALLSAEPDLASHRKALGIYLDLAASKDQSIAEEALYFAARQSFSDARYEEALTLFRRLKERFPKGRRAAETRVSQAWALYCAGRHNDALLTLRSDVPAKRGEDELYLEAASLRMLARHDEALRAYDEALKAYPSGRYAADEWLERLQVLSSMRDHAGVLKTLADRPDPPPSVAERAWWIAGESAQAVTNIPLAVQYMRLCSSKKDGVNAKEATYTLAWLLSKSGSHKDAAAVFRSVADGWPADRLAAQSLYAAGDSESKAGDIAAARRDWTRLLSSHPESPFAADALYRRATEEIRGKEYRQARTTLAEFLRRFPSDRRRAEACYFAAFAAERVNDDSEAEKLYRASLAADPPPEFRRESTLALGTLLKRTGRDAEAAETFSALIKDGAVDRIAADKLAWVGDSMIAAGRPDDAIMAAEALRRRDSDPGWNQVAEAEIGYARLAKGERDAALEAFRRALRFKSRTVYGAQAALEAGKLESEAGHYDEAKNLLRDAVERSQSDELLAIRARAYTALAANEDSRGDKKAALEYYMIVGSLFDDPTLVPPALWRASRLLDEQGRGREAADLAAELKKRYPDSAEAKSL